MSLRRQLWVNGFRPVAVKTGSKKACGLGWTENARMNPPSASSEWPSSDALNTGLLCDGLIALDIDVDDPSLAANIAEAAKRDLGPAPTRNRANSARCLLLYRAAEGEPTKRSVVGPLGKIEALGRGQQCVVDGEHESGTAYDWPHSGPDIFLRAQLTPVSQDALFAFLRAVAPMIGAEPPSSAPNASRPVFVDSARAQITERDRNYAAEALADEVAKLRGLGEGSGRNDALNKAAHSLGTLVGNGSLDGQHVATSLLDAAQSNGYVSKRGEAAARRTIESGLNAGIEKPRPLLAATTPNVSVDLPSIVRTAKERQAQPKVEGGKRTVSLIQGTSIQAKPITWLWHGYLPQGKLTLLAGAGGTGKSTLAFSIAATITNGGGWPDGSQCSTVGNVLIWSSEDDPADTIKPRLMAVSANESRYGVISGTTDEAGQSCPFDAAKDMEALREAVASIGGISLLIIDPIVTAVTGDMHKANDVRRSLQTIVDFAAECNCAVLGITHFAKGTAGKNSAERVIGSQAFAALARMVLVAAKEEESDRRVFTRAKSNNSVDTGGFSYSIEALTLERNIVATRVVWGEALEGSSRSILGAIEGETEETNTSKKGQAKRFLIEALASGSVPSNELFEQAREWYGLSRDTLRRAQSDLGVEAIKEHFAGGWVWRLPLSSQQR